MKFLSDNTAPATPEIMTALAQANTVATGSYGDDDWSKRLDSAFSDWFGTPVRAWAVATGTAANALSLACLSPPWGAVFCSEEAHVLRDECGACELQSAGARLVPVATEAGRIDAAQLARTVADHPRAVHSVQPAAITLTQATECGTLYTPDQIAAIGDIARAQRLHLQMDGARFANALASLQCHPADITWRAGVDVLSFGATKNGAMGAEAVVFFNPELAAQFELRRKRAAHLFSKMRYLSAQLIACLEGDWFMANAVRANQLAQRIGVAAGSALRWPVQANMAFLKLDAGRQQQLRELGFEFYPWGTEAESSIRLVVSWNQPQSDVDSLCKALSAWS
jgi:threonine aldolase